MYYIIPTTKVHYTQCIYAIGDLSRGASVYVREGDKLNVIFLKSLKDLHISWGSPENSDLNSDLYLVIFTYLCSISKV